MIDGYTVYGMHERDDEWLLVAIFVNKDDAEEWAYSIERSDGWKYEVRND